MQIKKIQVTSKRKIGSQTLRDSLTATEKKILVYMLNAGMNEGKVRNKLFRVVKLDPGQAEVTIFTTTKSILLGKNETIKQTVKIKYF